MNQLSVSKAGITRVAALALLAIASLVRGQTSEKAPADKGKNMKVVAVLRDDDCGSEAITRVKQVASRLGIEVTIDEIIVEDEEQAKARNWLGSPTVRIKGLDVDPKVPGEDLLRNDLTDPSRRRGTLPGSGGRHDPRRVHRSGLDQALKRACSREVAPNQQHAPES